MVGYARVNGPECEVCATGKFKDDYTNVHCSPYQACGSGEQVMHACWSEHDIVCGPCMAFISTLGLERKEEGLYNCNVGFELVGGACAQCAAGTFMGNTNNLCRASPARASRLPRRRGPRRVAPANPTVQAKLC